MAAPQAPMRLPMTGSVCVGGAVLSLCAFVRPSATLFEDRIVGPRRTLGDTDAHIY